MSILLLMNLLLGNSVRLPFRSQPDVMPAVPAQFYGETKETATFAVEPKLSPINAGDVAPTDSHTDRHDTQLFMLRVVGLNVQLFPQAPSALAD
jgi:hypothetical protein